MAQRRKEDVSKIVEDYRNRFPLAERQALRDAILKKYSSINIRTLNRHLKKAFDKKAPTNKMETQKEPVSFNQEHSVLVKGWDPPPDFSFSPNYEEAHRRKREAHEADGADKVQFPQVPFNWHNWSPYQLKVRLEVRVVLGGRNLGLIEDKKGYYNGEAYIPVEPYRGGLRDGCFTLPPDCARSTEETTIEVRARILDQNDSSKNEYTIIRSWTYDPKEKEWFYEPKAFTEDSVNLLSPLSLWGNMLSQLQRAGGHLIKLKLEKLRLGKQDTVTGWYEKLYDPVPIEGVIILKGAAKLEEALRLGIPRNYSSFLIMGIPAAFLATPVSVEEGDRFMWQNKMYEVKDTQQFFEGETLSYTLAKLANLPC
jgi:hypothetical protein